jgi:tetratricopeptide (TPR) repeat protein
MGFAGCLALAVLALSHRFLGRETYVIAIVVSVVCLAFGARSYARNLDWLDNRSMSKSQVKAVPNSYKAHAFYYGSLDDSIRNVDEALAIVNQLPDDLNTPVVFINAGKWYRDKGRTLASSAPADSAAWYRRSLNVLLRGESITKAVHENRPEIYEQLGLTYTRLGDFSDALQALETARRQKPSEDLIREISSVHLQMGNSYSAEITLWEGLLVYPGNPHYAAWLVDVYGRNNAGSCALRSLTDSSQLNIACPLVHEQVCAASLNLARMFRDSGQQSAAARFRDVGIADFGCPPEQR